jgi:signal transduction histidine kinase
MKKVIMRASVLHSKMARRLVRLFVCMIAFPLLITVIALQRVGREQVTWTAHTLEGLHGKAMRQAGQQFQSLGSEAIRQSGEQTQATSTRMVTSVAAKIAALQSKSLVHTSRELSALTSASFDDAMRQSLQTHHSTLDSIRQTMTQTVASSAQQTQRQAARNIQRAMLALNDTLLRERAQDMAHQFTSTLHNAPVFLQFTAQMDALRNGDVSAQKATLDALVRRLPEFLSVAVLDKAGQETALSASDRLVTHSDLADCSRKAYFQQALKGQSYMALDEQPANGAPVLRFAVPIEAYRGKVVGVIAARYSLESLWETIRGTRIGRQGYATVLDINARPLLVPRATTGVVLTASAPVDGLGWRVVVCVPRSEAMQPIDALQSDIGQNALRAAAQIQRDVRQSAQTADARMQRESALLRDRALGQIQNRVNEALVTVSHTTAGQTQRELAQMQQTIQEQTAQTQQRTDQKMVGAGEVAARQLTANVRPLMRQALIRADHRLSLLAALILFVFCVLGGALALLTADRIVRPVLRLVSVSQSIAEGDLEKRVETQAPDEIGVLALAFNKMADSLQQSRSELHETEAQLVQSAKLASLGTLSAGVAHELNQPVAIIRGVAQQLQGEPGLSDDVLSDLKLIEGQTGRMSKIITHLRTFCRAGSVEMMPVDAHEVIQNCLMFVSAQLKTHGIQVALQLDQQVPIVLADANELEQVFLNLITNARDALEGRDDACITIRTCLKAGQVVIEFADNGTGILDSVAARIFDPFFTTKEAGKGTGLGLSISHSIIKKHHGEIRVGNRPGDEHGAVFTILLPLSIAQQANDVQPLAA